MANNGSTFTLNKKNRMYDNSYLGNEFCTYVRNIDCDSSVLLLGRVVDLAVILELGQILAGQHLCNGGR